MVNKLESFGSVNNKTTLVHRANVRSAENIAVVNETVQDNPR